MKQHIFYILFVLTINNALLASEKKSFCASLVACCTTASSSPTPESSSNEILEDVPLEIVIEHQYPTLAELKQFASSEMKEKIETESILANKKTVNIPQEAVVEIPFSKIDSERLTLINKYLRYFSTKQVQSNRKQCTVIVKACNEKNSEWAECFTQVTSLATLIPIMLEHNENEDNPGNYSRKVAEIVAKLGSLQNSEKIHLETDITYSW